MTDEIPLLPANIDPRDYLSAIIASSDDAIISKDLNGNITSWNAAAEQIFGYSASEAIGKHISIIIPATALSEEDYIISQVKAGNRVEHFEATRRTKQGSSVKLSITVSPIKNSQGVIIGASKVARDITQLKHAENASAYLSAIIQSSDDAIISKDLQGFITSWNHSAERIFGYTSDEIIGRHITIIIPPDRISEEEKILTTLKTGHRIDHYETLRRSKKGELIPISLTVSPIKDSSGAIIGASKVARDISDRVKAENAIQEAGSRKDEFLANMSHELRTPLNAIIGLSHLMKNMELPDKIKKFVDVLHMSGNNLLELINDMLDFAKIESGVIEIEHVEFNLAEHIERAVSVINVKAQEKNLELHVNYASNLNHSFKGDPLRIHQSIMNLLSNAIKFTDFGSVEVDISGSARPDSNIADVVIRISDTGAGIPQDKLKTIFDKFMQADTSITRKFGGSGLGLAITKAFIEKMGGNVTVSSEVGVGSSFTLNIPLETTQHISAIEGFSVTQTPEATRNIKNVLLVEDYEPNLLVATSMLELLGYTYDIAKNGLEALKYFVQGQYDVIFMDLQMPALDGLEATKRIRRIEENKRLNRTPIVAMTAHVRDQDRQKCTEAGMDDFIPKPINPSELSQKITKYVYLSAELAKLNH